MGLGVDPEDMKALGQTLGQELQQTLRAALDRILTTSVELQLDDVKVNDLKLSGKIKISFSAND